MQSPILIYPGKNTRDDGKPLDLYGYLVNELDAHKIKASVRECSGFGGALKLLRAARAQIRARGYGPPGGPMAAYWKAVAVYAGHAARLINPN